MKKILSTLFVIAFLVASQSAFAQYEKGDKILNVGIGGGGYGYYGNNGGVAVGASYEYGIHDFISIGAQADFRFYSYNYFGGSSSFVSVPIAARGSYHYGKHFLTVPQLDLYAGPALGFNIDGSSYYNDSNIVIGLFAGAKYYFKPAFGVFVELAGGTNMIPVKAGVSFKF